MDNSLRQYTQIMLRKERKKIYFQYVLTLCFSVLCGGMFVPLLVDESLPGILRQIAVHFELSFFGSPSLFESVLCVLRYSIPDLVCGGICFLFSFSTIHCFISDLLLMIQGFGFGFSVWLLFQIEWARTPRFANGGYFFTFLFFRLCVLVLLTFLCAQTSILAMTQTQDLRTGRFFLPIFSVRRLILLLIMFFMAVLLLTGLYALTLYYLF